MEGLYLRPVQPEDRAFLYTLYASTRIREMALLGWDNTQMQAFLNMQFNAQQQYYAAQFPDAHWEIIELDSVAIGRLCTDRRPNKTHLIDISLLPQFCGQGIGGFLLKGLLAEAASTDKCVSIHVEQSNPAMRLYQRLGFKLEQDDGIYLKMEWCPSTML